MFSTNQPALHTTPHGTGWLEYSKQYTSVFHELYNKKIIQKFTETDNDHQRALCLNF